VCVCVCVQCSVCVCVCVCAVQCRARQTDKVTVDTAQIAATLILNSDPYISEQAGQSDTACKRFVWRTRRLVRVARAHGLGFRA